MREFVVLLGLTLIAPQVCAEELHPQAYAEELHPVCKQAYEKAVRIRGELGLSRDGTPIPYNDARLCAVFVAKPDDMVRDTFREMLQLMKDSAETPEF